MNRGVNGSSFGVGQEINFMVELGLQVLLDRVRGCRPRSRGELERLSAESLRKMRYIVTSYGPVAALRLAELISAEKPDAARRAALELYFRCLGQLQIVDDPATEAEVDNRWSDEKARAMVRELARGFE